MVEWDERQLRVLSAHSHSHNPALYQIYTCWCWFSRPFPSRMSFGSRACSDGSLLGSALIKFNAFWKVFIATRHKGRNVWIVKNIASLEGRDVRYWSSILFLNRIGISASKVSANANPISKPSYNLSLLSSFSTEFFWENIFRNNFQLNSTMGKEIGTRKGLQVVIITLFSTAFSKPG